MNSKIICFFSMLLVAFIANAAEFVATVSSKHVNVGQSLVLRLSLVGTKATEGPDLSPLLKNFTIYGQQQFSSYSNVNGNVTAEAGWDITLVAKQQGKVQIPSISIKTNSGNIVTEPIELMVDAANAQSIMDNVGISLAATISKNKTYVQEPVVYTLKIISYQPWANIGLLDIKSTDAIIEKVAEPKQYDQNYGGMRAHIIEVKYFITPLVAGEIEITAPEVHGEVQSQRGVFNSLFDYQPFAIKGDAITINAKAPPTSASSWLPLQDLSITEEWQGLDNVHEGDTIVRKIKIIARGGFSGQLPDLQPQNTTKDFKVYASKPSTENSIDPKSDLIIGTKIEEFSLVPRKAGTFVLPEIKVVWWNLRTNSQAVTTLPAKKIKVHAATTGSIADNVIAEQEPQASPIIEKANHKILYAIVLVFSVIILSMLIVIWILWRRSHQAKPSVSANKTAEPKSILDLKMHVLNYAQKNWHVSKDTNLNNIEAYLVQNNFEFDREAYVEFISMLNAALYANQEIDLPVLMAKWLGVRRSVVKKSKRRLKQTTSIGSDINPT